MAKVGMFKLIGWAFSIRDEINAAYSDDKAISASELLQMYQNLNEKIDFPVDEKTKRIMNLVSELIEEIDDMVADNKITVTELIEVADLICIRMGIDLDKTGFEIPKIEKKEEEQKEE